MAGTRAGGKKSEATIKAKYGADFYKNLGKMGGSAKGFASEKVDKNGLTGFQRAKVYGSVAGQISRRKQADGNFVGGQKAYVKTKRHNKNNDIWELPEGGLNDEPVGQTAA